jgi:hypothetical protein
MVKPLKPKTKLFISDAELDGLVEELYGRPYSFQQQDGCKNRGLEHVTVPVKNPEDYANNSVPEVINGSEMGVSFSAWLARDPKEWNGSKKDVLSINMFWERNFYPQVDMVLNDLHAKGLIQAGEYVIEIDW